MESLDVPDSLLLFKAYLKCFQKHFPQFPLENLLHLYCSYGSYSSLRGSYRPPGVMITSMMVSLHCQLERI